MSHMLIIHNLGSMRHKMKSRVLEISGSRLKHIYQYQVIKKLVLVLNLMSELKALYINYIEASQESFIIFYILCQELKFLKLVIQLS